jgi:serine/threonine protein kinase
MLAWGRSVRIQAGFAKPEDDMDSQQPTSDQHEKQENPRETERLAAKALLGVRLWEYRGPQEKLLEFDCGADEAIAELIRGVIRDGHGQISLVNSNLLTAQFGNSFNALSAAKSLQVRLLTFQRTPPAAQVVAAVMVCGHTAESGLPGANPTSPGSLLEAANSAQILVGETLYESARVVPGFQFSAQPVRAAGGSGSAEALYELLWTDESSYSHLRKTSQIPPVKAPTGPSPSRYQIQSELGRGAMGVVYKALDQVIGRTVALKTISIQRNFGDRNELVERLKQEAKAAGGLDHPNIITIYDVGQEEDFVYLSMQFIEGKTLATALEGGHFPPIPTLLSYVDQICSAVGFAHQRGVIHRDLKPANFMLTNEGTIKVLDFGIAKLGDAALTQTGMVVGTPTYMAPEQATGKKLDQRSDIFSLGTVFYELFTREKPFKGDIAAILYKLIHQEPTPPSVINPSLPNGIDAIIRKALAKDPKERYQTCEEMREAFREQATKLEVSTSQQIAVASAAETANPQPRPITSAKMRAVETSHRRAQRSVWPKIVIIVLVSAVALAAWAFRVKSRTGAFPAKLQKIVAVARSQIRMGAPNLPANDPSVVGQPQTSTASPADSGPRADPAPEKAATSNVDSAPVATEPATTAPTSAGGDVPTSGNSAATPPTQDAGAVHSMAENPPAESPSMASEPPIQLKTASATPTDTAKAQSGTSSANPGSEQQAPKDSRGVRSFEMVGPRPGSPSTTSEEQAQSGSGNGRRAARRSVERQGDSLKSVEGFTRSEIPDLLSKADAAAGAGDYTLARYEYGIVLRLDRQNSAARAGMARVIAARQERRNRE